MKGISFFPIVFSTLLEIFSSIFIKFQIVVFSLKESKSYHTQKGLVAIFFMLPFTLVTNSMLAQYLVYDH